MLLSTVPCTGLSPSASDHWPQMSKEAIIKHWLRWACCGWKTVKASPNTHVTDLCSYILSVWQFILPTPFLLITHGPSQRHPTKWSLSSPHQVRLVVYPYDLFLLYLVLVSFWNLSDFLLHEEKSLSAWYSLLNTQYCLLFLFFSSWVKLKWRKFNN
jgi:hypothetical protein